MVGDRGLEDRIDAAVTRLERLEGVRTWPGASELEIARAERGLGIRFPADFRALLLRTNGLELTHGGDRVFGVGDSAPLDLVWFNDPGTWRWAWPDRPDLDDLVVVGMSDTPDAIAYRRSELATSPDQPELHAGPIDLPGHLTWSSTLLEALEGSWQEMAAEPAADPVLSQHVRKFGHVAMNQAVVPGPQYFFPPYDERREHEGATLVDIDWAMISYADLLRSADEIEEMAAEGDVAVRGVETWTDDLGRTRLRWVPELQSAP